MSDNKENMNNEELLSSEDTEDIVEETIEKAIGEAELADAGESVIEGIHEDMDVSGAEYAAEPSVEYAVAESGMEDIPVKSKKGVVIAVVIAIVVALLAGIGAFAFIVGRAPYNYLGYINVSGKTVQDIADMQGGSLEDFLKAYSLPEDMPPSTYEAAAYYTIPTSVIADMYGMDFATLKETLQLPDTVSNLPLRLKLIDLISPKFNVGKTIDENTPWGITEGEASLSAYVGEENLESFKEEYGLGDNITGDTKWREVRNIVDRATVKSREEAEKEQAAAEEDGSDDMTDDVQGDADSQVPADAAQPEAGAPADAAPAE